MVTCVFSRIRSACFPALSELPRLRRTEAAAPIVAGRKMMVAWTAFAAAIFFVSPAVLLGQVSVSPTTLNWVFVPVGGRGAQKVVTLTNSGTASLTINSITFSGADPGDFAILSKTCGSSLAASSSCTVNIVFAPTTTGARAATLNFNDSASGSPHTMTLTGTGTAASGTVSASPTSLTFTSINVGSSSASQTVTLSNGLSTSISISSVAISGANAGDFSMASKTCGTSLAAASTCSASVVFKPTASGARTATLSFTDSATNSPQSVALTGSGVATGAGSASASPATLNWVYVAIGNRGAQKTITLTNTGTSSLTISGLSLTGANPGDFVISSKTCGTSLAASATCTANIVFAPTSTGERYATLNFGDSASNSPQTVALSGDGTANGTLTITPVTIALHAIGQTQFTASQSVTWSATCGSISSSGLYTAPAVTSTCTIKGTSTANSSNSATANASVTVVNYTTRRNRTDGTGVQSNELALTPTNVSGGKFGQLWAVGLDGPIWGQPLYMNGLTVGGKARNVVYVTTSNDSVYALDADTGALLWKKSFLSTGVTAVPGSIANISTQTGILGTPVIDPVKKAIFVVAETSENNATYFPHRLHALSLIDGSELTQDPELISDPDLQPIMKFQRPGLLLANGMVYVAFGSIGDRDPYHGLLFAFDENTLEQKAVFNVTPSGSEGGIWMSGASPEADSAGNIYISTGNGSAGTNNFGESIVKLSPNLQELDYFTPYNFSSYDAADLDLGSGSLIIVPDQNGPYPHEIIACGKPTPIYVINRDAFGGRGTTSDNIIQRLDNQIGNTGNVRDSGQPCYNSLAMWQQNVYFAPNYDVLKMFTLNPNTGMLSATPVSKGAFTYNWPGADPMISSNGNTNGIVWTIDVNTSTLHANDATDVSKSLYTSAIMGTAGRWVPPTVVNGHVYVTASGKIIAYGLTP